MDVFTLYNIKKIPLIITHNHHENYYFWQKSKIKNATLFHIDAHSDMSSVVPYFKNPDVDYHDCLNIANFICPAVHYGIISSAYWLNPYNSKKPLVDFGSKKADSKRPLMITKLEKSALTNIPSKQSLLSKSLSKQPIVWVEEYMSSIIYSWPAVSQDALSLEGNLILDVDLDAFCCEEIPRPSYYEKRINTAIKVLRKLKKPDLITITQSSGNYEHERYVPSKYVEKVQNSFIQSLNEIY